MARTVLADYAGKHVDRERKRTRGALVNRSAYWNTSLILFTCCAIGAASSKTSKVADTATIAVTIKSDVAQFVAGLNAHDVAKGTAFDAPNIIAIQCGSAPMVGAEADRAGFKEMFDRDPSWKARHKDDAP